MSAVVRLADAPVAAAPRLALLGTGVVGSAFVARYRQLTERGVRLPAFGWLANSRALHRCGEDPAQALGQAVAAPVRSQTLPPWAENEGLRGGDIVVDATASETVADWHPEWLARGVHVVTANKLGTGASALRAQAIQHSLEAAGARYGDSATVGAGLPLLSSLRALVAGGDRIHRVEGVLSGSLAWLFNRYDGSRPFSQLVRLARDAGYTEPDPRIDLSGEDVRRKLSILARAAGLPWQAEQVQVESLVPATLAALPLEQVDAALEQLDIPLAGRLGLAQRDNARLRFIGRFDRDGAGVGLQALAPEHPLCGGGGTDNRVAIFSDRYREQPLLIQGPGAGADVTAAALLDDVIAIAGR
ncbi:homoserine dehydrogenase [Pseudoxanthomonas wuyuanensis]|uniref:homoserine dehydrogenase n=1 Tax=Pseudoxanthomonas wuyuanensis TaxID=1073196 RepID=A0A286D4C7_9GAMM|nr:homoserine dehydrogenase [Pseudoxanthomonas wuyuanensis]KAF1719732.1 homoserine dehydrogenase [Pseudoxanthomonas wuyuanensis]SOD53505.1 homoserine dehydrogenase [Pseudoxanthomonas wuyuanensis]